MARVKITESDLLRVLEVARRVAARTGRIAVPRWDNIEIVPAVGGADLQIVTNGGQPAITVGVV